mgnify:CR=1 FL=1
MFQRVQIKRLTLCLALVSCLALLALQVPARAQSVERTSVTVVVKDAASDQPMPNARLTLIFKEPRKLKRDKGLSYSAKTNPQGRYKFVHIPKGTIRLVVTAERHQSFGQDFELEQDNQVVEVKLKKPQPLL